jgi:hypothetical protein
MAYEEVFAIRQAALDSTKWTDITGVLLLPIPCNTVVIVNNSGGNIALRSDPGNANSEITIPTGQQFEIGGFRPVKSRNFRFTSDSIVCSLKPAAGNPVAVVESIQ